MAFLHKSGIQAKVLKIPEPDNHQCKLESLWCHIKWDRHQVVLASLYRLPRHTQAARDADIDQLDRQLQLALMTYPQCANLLAGDLNCNMLNTQNSSGRDKLSEFLVRYSLAQHVTCPTFTFDSLLDLHSAYQCMLCCVPVRSVPLPF